MKKIPVMIPYFSQDEKDALSEVLDSGWVAQGPKVAEFEKAIAAHEGVRHGIATTSCTTALHLAMVVLGIQEGMDVIAPSFTFVATVNTIKMTGAEPVLADICKDTYNIDPDYIYRLIKDKYTPKDGGLYNAKTGNRLWGIVAVHQFGLCADMDRINKIAAEFNLQVLEDAACAVGAKIGGIHQGGFGHVSCLSFHPRKSITTGEGGMILTNDDALADRMRTLRSHGASVSAEQRHSGKGFLLPEFNEVGYNYRMNDIQAAVGLVQTKKLDWLLSERNRRAAIYNRLINDKLPFLITPKVPEDYYHSYQSYVCMLDPEVLGFDDIEKCGAFRNDLLAILEENGISTRQGTHAVHTLGYYRNNYGYTPQDLPVAYVCDRLSITLPLYVQMSDEDQEDVITMIQKVREQLL
ncbi:DegT/DnrJ/EryC1/StrS family aminotransferase [Paenibacillus sedimenti]|uniref:DegT/DnrJ/EryC1/StrS family aminotransferase n=1 Tax=Paenibacillus sedimenti TaxID=2770274 RepID=A0A926KV96_9BACL|nr:DegT/DnrJ/EryC1/StrS family aminotransferase [Paenibacillus sedimenti]MBD0384172.1 DegT/DnrJ/EryC1/StrS family aminotransferase [Paenibacillus sedimenti]